MSSDAVRRSSNVDTFSTRLSVFRISMNPRNQMSTNGNRRTNGPRPSQSYDSTPEICWRKFLIWICPCLMNLSWNDQAVFETQQQQQQRRRRELNSEPIHQTSVTLPTHIPHSTIDDDNGMVTNSLLTSTRSATTHVEHDGLTCDTLIIKHENESDELLSDENDVTIQQTSFTTDQLSINSNPTLSSIQDNHRHRSQSDGHHVRHAPKTYLSDNKSLK